MGDAQKTEPAGFFHAGGTGGHGGNVWAASRSLGVERTDILDLSTNTFTAMGPETTALLGGLPSDPSTALCYPDPHATRLRAALAEAEGVAPEQMLPGNGASELIWATLTALRPGKALFVGPLFTEYARACHALHIPHATLTPPDAARLFPSDAARLFPGDATAFPQGDAGPQHAASGNIPFTGAFAPEEGMLMRITASDADLVIVCSPNNPGTAVLADAAPLLEAVGQRTLVLDASYKDFLWDEKHPSFWETHSYPHLAGIAARTGTRLVLLGSLTKFYCCPGVRLGFAVSDSDTTALLEESRPAWTLSAAAEEAGALLLSRRSAYRAALPALRQDVESLAASLRQTGLFRAVHPGVSFVSAALTKPDQAMPLRDFLLTSHNVLIRVCDNIPGMPPGFVRIQARPRDELQFLFPTLAAWASGTKDSDPV